MKKYIALILVLCLVLLTGCSGSKELVMGTNAMFPPFEFITQNGLVGSYDGIDVAIALEIAKEMGKELRVDDMEFTAVLAAVPAGKVDMAVAGITADDERRQNMDFSDTYFLAAQNIVVKSDNEDITNAATLEGHSVGAIEGYTGEKVCRDQLGLDVVTYRKAVDGILAVKQGKLDALVLDSHTAFAMVALNNDLKAIEDPDAFETEEYAIAVKKGNAELLATINKVLGRMKSDGSMDAIIQKYGDMMAQTEAE